MTAPSTRPPARQRARAALTTVLLCLATLLLTPPPASAASTWTASAVTTTVGTTNVSPMWGPQTPKVVHDGSWYYAVTVDGSGTQHPWTAKIWKSANGTSWSLATPCGGWVSPPPGLVLDSGNRLWLYLPCYTGGECYPGVSTLSGSALQYVYLQRLQFSTKLGDGSFDFSTYADHSVRTTTAERYYGGLAIDLDRRYIHQAYSKNGWGLFLSSFDTWTNTETTRQVATPGTSPQEAYLYPRIRPGTAPGELWMLFNQSYTGGASTEIFGVQLWRSTDGGATWSGFMVASCPSPGDANFCDNSDLVIDANDAPHVLFYKKISGVSHLYYWKGTAGSVTLPGSPVDLGAYDNHAQLAGVGTGEKFVFAHAGPTTDNQLKMLRSTNGTTWTTESYPVSAAGRIYSPNLLRPESGSFHSQAANTFSMLLSGTPSGTSSPYSRVDFLTVAAG